MKKLFAGTLIAAGMFVFANCNSSKKAAAAAPAKLSYESNVQSLVIANCSPCHIPEKGGKKKDYSAFANVKSDIDDIIRRIQLHPGERGFMPMRGTRLSDSTINVFKQWKTDGLLEK